MFMQDDVYIGEEFAVHFI